MTNVQKISPNVYPGIDKGKTDFMGEVVKLVSLDFNLTPEQLYSSDASRNVSRPRYYAMYIIREVTRNKIKEIAGHFSRHHSIISHATRFSEDDMSAYPAVKLQVRKLLKQAREMHDALLD